VSVAESIDWALGISAPDSELLLADEVEELEELGAEVNHLLARAIQNMMHPAPD
jgi:hypothetical protein